MEFWDFFVFGALAIDIRNFICACNPARRGGAKKKLQIKFEMLGADMAAVRNMIQALTILLKGFPFFWVAVARK